MIICIRYFSGIYDLLETKGFRCTSSVHFKFLELIGDTYRDFAYFPVPKDLSKKRITLRVLELDTYLVLTTLGFTPEQIAEHIRASRNDNLHTRKQSRDS